MTIKEICEKYGLSPDTLRYYEKTGVIPTVGRSSGGIRNYTEEDIGWIENAVCMRSAGMSVEKLAEYVRLAQIGDSTYQERLELLLETRTEILQQMQKYQEALDRLDYKISRYEEAVRTGELHWDKEDCQ